MPKFIVLVAFLVFSLPIFAQDAAVAAPDASTPPPVPPTAIVTKLRGEVFFEGQLLKEGDKIERPGKINTKDRSYIQLTIDKWKNTISIGPNSHMVMNFSDDKKYTLETGYCRWKSFAKSLTKGKIHTRNVALGVRGTDFYLKVNRILGETEVIMFDGEVLMENASNKDDTLEVKKGQWGGLGGRFGEKIRGPIDLPKEVLDTTDKILE